MNKKIYAILVIAIFTFIVFVFPRQGSLKPKKIIHQHIKMPDKSNITTGLDEQGELTSHLPLIIIETNGREIPGQERLDDRILTCNYKIVDQKDGINCSKDSGDIEGKLQISIRGNSSRKVDKKQFSIKLVDYNQLPVQKSLLGMPKESTWVLNGSEIDYSQLRNYILYNLSGEIMTYAPQSRLCEVMFINKEGKKEYQGVYTLIEKPKVSMNRLNLKDYEKKHTETSFLLSMNSPIEGIKIKHLKPEFIRVLPCELIYPDKKYVTKESVDYVQKRLYYMEKVLYDSIYLERWNKVSKYFDLDTFVDYYIINEFFQNYDAGRRSTYLYCDLGGKLSIGPVWDFDGAMNNFGSLVFRENELRLKTTYYYYFLCQNPNFINRLESRYHDLRNTYLSDDYLIKYIDESYAYAKKAIYRNCDRWYKGDYEYVEQDIREIKDFIKKRGKWMDNNFIEKSQIVD